MQKRLCFLIVLSLFAVICRAEAFEYISAFKGLQYQDLRTNPDSSMAKLDTLIAAAKSENKTDMQIAGLINQLSAIYFKQESSDYQAILRVQKELETSTVLSTAILHRILAQLYKNILVKRRYQQMIKRSEKAISDSDDVSSWDNSRLAKAIIREFQLSLEHPELLQAEPLLDYRAMLAYGGIQQLFLRPTLYDLLAWDALEHYMESSPDLTLATNEFCYDDPMYLSEAEIFSQLDISHPDSLSHKYLALKLYQDLIRFHLQDEDPKTLVDFDLKRLHHIYFNSSLPGKDELFEAAMLMIRERYDAHESSAHAAFNLAILYHNLGAKYDNNPTEDSRWYYKRAYDFCREAYERFPESHGGKSCEALMRNIAHPSLDISLEEDNIPNANVSALLSVRNLNKVQIMIYKIPYKNIQAGYFDEIGDWAKHLGGSRIIEWKQNLLQTEPIYSKIFTFEDEGDYRTKSYEIPLKKLPAGHYLALAASVDSTHISSREVFGFNIFDCNNLILIHPKMDSKKFLITNRDSGLPVPGARIQMYDYDYKAKQFHESWLGQTGDDGRIELPTFNPDSMTRMLVSSVGDTLQMLSLPASGHRRVHPSPVVLMFPDRAIYRPGQIVHVKGLVYRFDGEISHPWSAFTGAEIYLEDVNRQKVGSCYVDISELGTFDASFTIPADRLTGTWHIYCSSRGSGVGSTHGRASIKVEEYKRPRFEVSLDNPKHSYSLGKQVTLEGRALTYAGAAVDNASVQYRISRQAKYPYWFWWWGAKPDIPEKEIQNGSTITGVDGSFQITFSALGDQDLLSGRNHFYSFRIEATVTDINGETRSGVLDLKIGERDLILSADIPEHIDKNGKLNFTISSLNVDEEPIGVNGDLKISLLKPPDHIQKRRLWKAPNRNYMPRSEFLKALPTSIYADEDRIETWQPAKEMYASTFHTLSKDNINIKNISLWPAGSYRLEINTIHNDVQYKEIQYFTVYDSKSTKLPYLMAELFIPVKVICEPGEEAQILIGSSYENVRVIFEIEKNHVITESKILRLNRDQRILRIPVTHTDRGNFFVHISFVRDGRIYLRSQKITVPWTNKELKIEYITFRDKLLPGQQEEWRLKIKDHKGNNVSAEVLASMYDASLDALYKMDWPSVFYGERSQDHGWSSPLMPLSNRIYYIKNVLKKPYPTISGYSLNWYYMPRYNSSLKGWGLVSSEVTSVPNNAYFTNRRGFVYSISSELRDLSSGMDKGTETSSPPPQLRVNFAETAFFYPRLLSDKNGEVSISFTIPESLTRWKFRAFAIADSLRTGSTQNITLTQKPLMVNPNPPRFFRHGDSISLSAKITVMDDENHSGHCVLELFDPISGASVDSLFALANTRQQFEINKGESTVVNWDLKIPHTLYAVGFRVWASSGDFTDGEEHILPILTNRTLVTESLPLPMRGKSARNFSFENLKKSGQSSTLQNHSLSLEFTSNPTWYAVQALTYLMEKQYESLDEITRRHYSNVMGSHILKSNPIYKRVFDDWKTRDCPDALLSNLQKNQEFKNITLLESPWLLDSISENEDKKRIGTLFDENRLTADSEVILNRLQKCQLDTGAWPWFPGGDANYWTTQSIVESFGRLHYNKIRPISSDTRVAAMLNKAIRYLDSSVQIRYEELKKKDYLSSYSLSYIDIQYLYVRSYFPENPILEENREAVNYLINQAKKHWIKHNFYAWGAIALALDRFGESDTATTIVKALKENALYDDEMGMYWKLEGGWYWHQSSILRQAVLIEAFSQITQDTKSVDEMKLWLLKNKQTNRWTSHKATTDACFALLTMGTSWITDDSLVDIQIGGKYITEEFKRAKHAQIIRVNPRDRALVEAGTGYFKQRWSGHEINDRMADINIRNPNNGPAWGAIYWQYFEDLDKISAAETPLRLKKQLFVERLGTNGPVLYPISDGNRLKVGDKVIVRIELRTDREMDYLHLKDMRSAGFEPLNVLSGYKYQDGLWYYEATGDAATNFFIEKMQKGTYVFEYALRVMQKGDFSNGISTIQCLYAPEYSAHSEGIRIEVR